MSAKMNLPKKAMQNMATSKMYPVARAALSVALVSWFMVLRFEVKRMCVSESHPSVGYCPFLVIKKSEYFA
jgi:hypothetical protein